jgi:hypothetical protein
LASWRIEYTYRPHSALGMLTPVEFADQWRRFSEFRTGLDHLEFLVPRRQDPHEWAERLDELASLTQA